MHLYVQQRYTYNAVHLGYSFISDYRKVITFSCAVSSRFRNTHHVRRLVTTSFWRNANVLHVTSGNIGDCNIPSKSWDYSLLFIFFYHTHIQVFFISSTRSFGIIYQAFNVTSAILFKSLSLAKVSAIARGKKLTSVFCASESIRCSLELVL